MPGVLKLAMPGEPSVYLYQSAHHRHLGVLFATDHDQKPSAVCIEESPDQSSVIGVQIEDHGGHLLLRHPVTHAFLEATLQPGGTSQLCRLAWNSAPDTLGCEFFLQEKTGSTCLHPAVHYLVSIEAAGTDPLSAEQMAFLLAGDDQGMIELFWCLLDFMTKPALLEALPLLAEQHGYSIIYRRLQQRLSAGDGIFPLHTRSQLHAEVQRFGWNIGDHTYGRPMLVDESSAMLTIGKYCSIAGFSTIVLGNHTMNTATTFPFALLSGYWPHSLAGIGLVDHVGRDVVIGSDVWMGISAVVLPGTVVGHGAIIGANAVVRGNIPPYAIVAGNPGRVIRYRFNEQTIARLLNVAWWDWPDDKVDRFIPLLLDPDVTRFLDAAEAGSRLVQPSNRNIALGQPARQSSLFPWSKSTSADADACNLVNGRLTGGYQCHTNMENEPWWQVDLGKNAAVEEIRIHNRLDRETASRSQNLSILSSDDGNTWTEILCHAGKQPFGGIDGRPLVWRPATEALVARFIRIELKGFTCLHFDQVEVFGSTTEASLSNLLEIV